MDNKRKLFDSNIKVCSGWAAVTKAFDQLPKPALRRDEYGETQPEGWIYRGHKSQRYGLEPSIERECPDAEWAVMEDKILGEFQAKAQLHIEPSFLPPAGPNSRLSWLALMQHYGVPTRLLDFTYSPYVALYFALRNRKERDGGGAEVWGIDAVAVKQRASKISKEADREERDNLDLPKKGGRTSFLDVTWPRQIEKDNADYWDTAISNALNPGGIRRSHYNHNGLIAVALPPVQNLRLSSQQGVFLFNGAEDLSFEGSLELMMGSCGNQWYKRFRIREKDIHRIEEQLFR